LTAGPTHHDVAAAADWLTDHVIRTPVLRCAELDALAGGRMWLKAENLQTTGCYKFRGALRAVGRIAGESAARGVIAQSTGNHAIAVAAAAQRYGLPAILVLSADAAPTKIALIQAAGGNVHLTGETLDDRLAEVEALRRESGYAVVDAYDNTDVIAGQGSAARELVDQVARQGTRLDAIVVPVGGGGGVAGTCLAVDGQGTAVYGVEPVGCDSLRRSLAQGQRVKVPPAATLADGLRPTLIGRHPFQITRSRLAGALVVDDQAIAEAVCLTLLHAKLVVEPSGAAALAGALQLAATTPMDNIGVLLTGGNIDPALLGQLVTQYTAEPVELARPAPHRAY
jgi:threo-3-hydroxy-L-aspartate ammonia-lyase